MTTTARRWAATAARLPRVPHADGVVAIAVVLLIGGPAIFTSHAFAPDFVNHLWLVSVQEHAISAHLSPTFFVNAPKDGVFYPFFLFYGATLYSLAGLVGAVLGGHVLLGYILVSLAAIAAGYTGMLALARLFGMRGWRAYVPALVFISSAYYVTNIYGRGAWPEFIATSMWPPAYACAISILRTPRVRWRAAIGFVISIALIAGSHNITLVLGVLATAAAVVLLLLTLGRHALPSPARGLTVAGLAVLGVALDAWFLLPDLLQEGQTAVSRTALIPAELTSFLNTPGVVLDPGRVSHVVGNPVLYVQIPVLFLGWGLFAIPFVARRSTRRSIAAAAGMGALIAALLVAITVAKVWDGLPSIIREAQFPYRLNTYVCLAIAGLLIAVCHAWQSLAPERRRDALLGVLLLAVTAVSLGFCVSQLWSRTFLDPYSSVHDVALDPHANPRTWYDTGDYHDVSQVLIDPHRGRSLTIPPARINTDHVSLTITPPAGTAPFSTNIAGGPDAVAVSGGVRVVGRNTDNEEVLARTHPGSGRVRVNLSTAGGAITDGRIISFVALGVCGALLLLKAGRLLSDRRRVAVP